MKDIYEFCPEFENEKYLLRFVKKSDSEDLIEVYGDKNALPFFNSDNCHGDNFFYDTKEKMDAAIDFWIYSYEQGYFVRWAIVDKSLSKAVGTIEFFHRPSDGNFGEVGLIRLDLGSAYEKSEIIREILSLIIPPAYELFECDEIISKVPLYAVERADGFRSFGFTKTDTCLIGGNDGYAYNGYWKISKRRKLALKNLIVRAERPEDFYNTELMTMRSFWNKYHPGCTEHNMLRIVRASKDYLPEISRVAELDGKIVGAVFYTKAWIVNEENGGCHEVAMLGPLAVEPTLEGNNIGGTLIYESVELAKKAGIKGIILAGEPDYYPKFGFRRCEDFCISDGDGNYFDAYMCLPLSDEFKSFTGHFVESKDFEKIGDEESLEKISAEFPSYRKVMVQEDFMQIFNEHLGVVESIDDGVYQVRYWEILIPCRLSDDLASDVLCSQLIAEGSDVQFKWNHKSGELSTITKPIKNLLD